MAVMVATTLSGDKFVGPGPALRMPTVFNTKDGGKVIGGGRPYGQQGQSLFKCYERCAGS
jgi:hypothetical protein